MSEFVVKEFTDLTPLVDYRKRTVELVVSTPDLDRDGEIVAPRAFEKDIDSYIGTPHSNPILILSHVHKSMPVGKCIEMRFDDEYTWAKYWLSKTQAGEETLTLFKEGVLKGCSPGFIPIVFYDNPPPTKLPKLSLKTLNGRRCKRLYERCELVEVSALAIPSNRKAVVGMAEKGNSVAGLVVKMFDARMAGHSEQLPLIIKEWIDEYTAKTGFGEFVEKGLFTDCPEMVTKGAILQAGINEAPKIWHYMFMPGSEGVPTENQQTNMRLDQMIGQQQQMIEQLQAANDKDSWTNWAKTWGTRLGIAGAAYLFFNKTNLGQAMKDRAKQHVYDWAVNRFPKTLSRFKGVKENEALDAVKMLTDAVDILGLSLEKGKELGLGNTKLYKDLATKYGELTDEIHDLVLNKGFAIDFSDFVIKEPSDITEEIGSGFSAFIKKEMTKEEFRETEHPRNQDGTFRKKNTAAKASRPKGTHGGKREGAGRLPSQANLAVEARRMQYKKQFPGATDQEVDNKIREDAAKLRKPDWVVYMDNPVEYQKEQARQMEDALRSKYNKTYSRNQRIVIKEGSLETAMERAKTTETQAKFEKDVIKARAMGDAYATLSDEDATQLDRSRAKLLLGVGFIASTLALAGLMLRRPNWVKAGFKKIAPEAEEVVHGGAKFAVRPIVGIGNTFGADLTLLKDRPTIFAFDKISEQAYQTTTGFTQRVKNLIGTAIRRIQRQEGYYSITGGPNWTGFSLKGGQYPMENSFVAKYVGPVYKELPDKQMMKVADDAKQLWVPRPGDLATESGLLIVNEQGKINWLNLLTNHRIELAKKNMIREARVGLRPEKAPFYWQNSSNRYVVKRGTREGEIEEWLVANGKIRKDGKKYTLEDKKLVPDYILQVTGDAEEAKFKASMDIHKGWSPFFNQRVGKLVSRKTLSLLAATGAIGTGTAYYFHQDIAGFTDDLELERKRIAKINEEEASVYGASATKQDEVVKRLREERLTALAQEKASAQKTREFAAQEKLTREQGVSAERLKDLVDGKIKPETQADQDALAGALAPKALDSSEIVTKAAPENTETFSDLPSIDEIAAAIAFDMSAQIEDISQTCKTVIESGMPGHTHWEDLNLLVQKLYLALKEGAKEEPIEKGFEEFVTKEMTAEEFKEEEHKRASDGKFAKMAGGGIATQKKKIGHDGDSNLGYKIAAGVGAVALAIGAHKLLKGSNIWKVSGGNPQKAEAIAKNVLSATGKDVAEPTTKAARHILNLEIVDKVSKEELERFSPDMKDIYVYLKDPTRFTKDLMAQFGHLEASGPTKLKISGEFNLDSMELADRLDSIPAFQLHENAINANVRMIKVIQDMKIENLDAKGFLIHEYAHGINYNSPETMSKLLPEYKNLANSLVGKDFHADIPGLIEGKAKIIGVDIVDPLATEGGEDILRKMSDEQGLTLDLKRLAPLEQFKGVRIPKLLLKIESPEGPKTLDLGKEMLIEGMERNRDPQVSFIIDGIDGRTLYGLNNLSEYCAVLSERGVRL